MNAIAQVKIPPADSCVGIGILWGDSRNISIKVHELLEAGQHDLPVL